MATFEGAMKAIGYVGKALGIVGFLQSNLPSKAGPSGTAINIKAGISPVDDPVHGLGGKISAVYGYNVYEDFIGISDSKTVKDGDYVTFILDQKSPGEQAEYISVANSNDATCIAWISVQMHDDTTGGAWTGDIGAECGQRWHFGNQKAGVFRDSNEDYRPKCTWLDSDFTDGTVSAAMKFHISSYGKNAEDTLKNNDQCDSTIFGPDNGPIAGSPAKRSAHERPQWIMERLMVSNSTHQNAEDLCTSETSWGPDFIGGDGKFCDMSSKQLIPLCSVEDVDGCVEVSDAEMTVAKRSTVARRRVKTVHKSYKTITHNHD